ncbi:hypothetical protein CK203_101570 [Vitis vinifera]|uniref:Reverse transcriptase domain-containing protein n=1 Tax=Vitis vinifera TaxID=29760 RepID=A0A438DMU5_VITVI|nr:hypothetical protein CK203_101570 [Vitis vinifera]
MSRRISDFRPISLITSLYKIIAKVLAGRLRGKNREEGVVFKIDFEKAYDHVSWDFLDHVLEMKGFSLRWRKWMRGCLSSVFLCSPSERMLLKAEERNVLEGFRVGRNRTRVSHLQFADDTIFFSSTREEDMMTLKNVLLVFGHISGLKVNLDKATSMALILNRIAFLGWPRCLTTKLLGGLYFTRLPLGGNPKARAFGIL